MSHLLSKAFNITAAVFVVIGLTGLAASNASAHGRHAGSGPHQVFFSDYVFPTSLNPAQVGTAAEQEQLGLTQPSANLMFYRPNGTVNPFQLQGPPVLSTAAGQQRIQISLNAGMKWNDGTPISNQDYKFAWDIYMNANTGPACLGTCDNVATVVLNGVGGAGLGIQLRMKWNPGPNYYRFPHPLVPNAFVGLLPEHWSALGTAAQRTACLAAIAGCNAVATNLENPALDYMGTGGGLAVTAGPYEVSSVTVNSTIDYVQNPNFTAPMGLTAGGPTSMKFIFYSSVNTMIAGADNHDTDVTQGHSIYQYLSNLDTNNNFTTSVGGGYTANNNPFRTANPELLLFNSHNAVTDIQNGPSGVTNPVISVKVRRALSLAYNRAGLISYAYGVNLVQATNLVSYCAPIVCTTAYSAPYFNAAIKGAGAWDPLSGGGSYKIPGSAAANADAVTLMTQAGALGDTIYLTAPTGNPVYAAEQQYLQASWQNVFGNNFHVVLENVPGAKYYDPVWANIGTLAHGRFEAAIMDYGGTGAGQVIPRDPDHWKNDFLSGKCMQTNPVNSPSSQAYGCFGDGAINTELNNGGRRSTFAGRHAWYNAFQARVVKRAYVNVLAPQPNIWTQDAKPSAGFQMNQWVPNDTWNSQFWQQ